MRVFISWSGVRSQAVAEHIRDWLPNVLQSVEPYFTPSDLEKGGVWASEISRELANSEVGILCVTRDNVTSPWLLFEAGALSKQMEKTYVCPVLFDIKPTDLAGPLAQFQAAKFEHDDFLRLIGVVNERLGERKIAEKTLNNVFEKFWPDLQNEINRLLESETDGTTGSSPRDDREILEEILQLVRKPRTNTRISSVAIVDLLKHYIALHDEQARKEGDYQSTLNSLRKMHDMILYIVKRQGPEIAKNDMVRRFNKLSYEVAGPETSGNIPSPDEFDDDIPF